MYPGITTDNSRLHKGVQSSVAYEMGQEDIPNLEELSFDSSNVFWIKLLIFTGYLVGFIIITTGGVVINHKLLWKLKNEAHKEKGKVIQRVMETYALVQLIAWPSFIWVGFLIWIDWKGYSLFHPCLLLYIKWTIKFSWVLLRVYVGLNSLVVALCRYLFLVHDDKILHFGVQRARKIIITSSWAIPLAIAFLHDATIPSRAPIISTLLTDRHRSCPLPMIYHVSESFNGTVAQSPIYIFTENYIPTSVVYGAKLITFIVCAIIASNTIEGLLYSHTFIHIRR